MRCRGIRRSSPLRGACRVVVPVIIVVVARIGRLGKLGIRGRRAGVNVIGHDVPEPKRPQQATGKMTDEATTPAARLAAKGALGGSWKIDAGLAASGLTLQSGPFLASIRCTNAGSRTNHLHLGTMSRRRADGGVREVGRRGRREPAGEPVPDIGSGRRRRPSRARAGQRPRLPRGIGPAQRAPQDAVINLQTVSAVALLSYVPAARCVPELDEVLVRPGLPPT